jgi:hypothetical protein
LTAEGAETGGQVGDPLPRDPVVRERNAGFAASQHVAECLAEVPGHDALDGQYVQHREEPHNRQDSRAGGHGGTNLEVSGGIVLA